MRNVLLAGIVAVSGSAWCITGNQALEVFPHPDPTRNIFIPYAMGMMDAEIAVRINWRIATKGGEWALKPYCPPSGATYVQGGQIIEGELRRFPEKNHEDLGVIARRAFTKAWPCSAD